MWRIFREISCSHFSWKSKGENLQHFSPNFRCVFRPRLRRNSPEFRSQEIPSQLKLTFLIATQHIALPALQKTFDLPGNFAFKNGGDLGDFFSGLRFPRDEARKLKKKNKIRGKIRGEKTPKNSGNFRSATLMI